jgi:hypothetical protein
MGSDQLGSSTFKLVGTERGSKVRGVEAFTTLQEAFPFQNKKKTMHRFYEPSSSSMDSVGIEPLVDDRGELDELEQLKIMLRKATVEIQDIEGEYQGKKELQHSNNRIKNIKIVSYFTL